MTDSQAVTPLTAEEEASIRSGWWGQRANRGALPRGYVTPLTYRLLATLDAARSSNAALRTAVEQATAELVSVQSALDTAGERLGNLTPLLGAVLRSPEKP